MTYVVFHNQLSFQPVDAQGVPTGPEEIVTKGGEVPEYVPPYIVSALTQAGMIVDAGDRDEDAIRRMVGFDYGLRQGRALPNPEQPMGAGGEPPLFTLSGDPGDHGEPEMTTAEATGQPFLTSDEGSVTRGEAPERAEPSDETPGTEPAEPQGDGGEPYIASSKPGMRDPKAAWEQYAEQVGMDRGEAESMTKPELIAAVEAREQQ
jgi:hypothetical protein